MRRWIAPFLLAAVCLAVGAAATALAEGKGRFVMDRLQAFAAPPLPAPFEPAPPPPGGPDRQPPRPPRGPGGPEDRAGDHLAHAYEHLTLAALALKGDDKAGAKDLWGLLDSAREFYRTAHKAYKDGDYDRADEMAHAAEDAAHGILLTLQADAGKLVDVPAPPVVVHGPPPPPRDGRDGPPPPPRDGREGPPPGGRDRQPPPPPGDRQGPPPPRPGDREGPPPPPRDGRDAPPPRGDRDAPPPPRGDREPPPPPPGRPDAKRDPKDVAEDMIQHVGDRLKDAPKDDDKGPGHAFLEAAQKSLDAAQRALKAGDAMKAVDLALAADVWSHVSEHLQHADHPDRDRPRPAAPDDRRQPPPRPPEEQ